MLIREESMLPWATCMRTIGDGTSTIQSRVVTGSETRTLFTIWPRRLQMLFLNLNPMECLSVELRRVRFIKEHSEVNQRTSVLVVRHTDAAPSLIEQATVCFTLCLVVPSATIASSSLSTSHLILSWTKDNALELWLTTWLMVLSTECVPTKLS